MSIVSKETIEVIAQSIGINNLSQDVALALAPDVEYRVRQIMQEAIKCMCHSKRTILTADDVDSALNLRNVEPIYGFASGDPLRFKRAVDHKDLFYVDDKDVEFRDLIEAPLPKAPLDTAIVVHWLAIEGVQPAIPENATVEASIAPVAPPDDKKSDHNKEDGLPIDVKLPVKHVLSRELQLYFDKFTELTVSQSESNLFKKALMGLATDSGLHPLVPYFTHFIADEVYQSLNDLPLLFALMRVVRTLLQNPHIHIEPYLHQLMPSVITCIVAKKLGHRFVDNHWELRDFSANLVASICGRFGHVYHTLQTRVTRTLLNAFLDPKKAMTQHYGAIQGFAALGPSVVCLLMLPNLESYMQLLEPEMLLEKQKNGVKRHEAWRVYGALLRAAGQCLYDRFKLLPGLLSPPVHPMWQTNKRIVTMPSNKRKAGNNLWSQPPLKKVASDGTLSSLLLPANMNSSPTMRSDSEVAPSSLSRPVPNEETSEGGNRRETWKKDMDVGHLLTSLLELFGEGIVPFIPSPEMSFFL